MLPPKVRLYDFHFMMTHGPVFHRGEGKHDHFENTALKIVTPHVYSARYKDGGAAHTADRNKAKVPEWSLVPRVWLWLELETDGWA